MAELLSEFADVLIDEKGIRYHAHACGGAMPDGRGWQGWLEFVPLDGGPAIRSGRETTQPNLKDTQYWATGLTPVYLEGALRRALRPVVVHTAARNAPAFEGPASFIHTDNAGPEHQAVLNPFSVYDKGEALLRNELHALAPWHLVNIIEAYGLSDESPAVLNRLPTTTLVQAIVSAVSSMAGTR